MLITNDLRIPCALYEKGATLYKDDQVKTRAVILYFHGGGLIYGNRNDLPKFHIEALCAEGLAILAIDYAFAPAVSLRDM